MKHGDLSMKHGDLSMKNCDLSMKHGDLSMKNGDLSMKQMWLILFYPSKTRVWPTILQDSSSFPQTLPSMKGICFLFHQYGISSIAWAPDGSNTKSDFRHWWYWIWRRRRLHGFWYRLRFINGRWHGRPRERGRCVQIEFIVFIWIFPTWGSGFIKDCAPNSIWLRWDMVNHGFWTCLAFGLDSVIPTTDCWPCLLDHVYGYKMIH